MARPGRQERNRAARSFRQLRRFHHVINSNKVFGTHNESESDMMFSMHPKQDFNSACPACSAKLLVVRIPSPSRRGERATCPYCMESLQPRDAGDLIQYRLVRGPSPNTVAMSQMANPKDKLFEREEIRQRMADFKATQVKFEREREEYFEKTMAKVRSSSSDV
jgi:hypothetical protein